MHFLCPYQIRYINRLLPALEKIPLAGIARVAEVFEPWLQNCVKEKYASVPQKIKVRSKKRTSNDRH